MTMRMVSSLVLCLLFGCDSPSPRFNSGERFDTQLDGTRFTVWKQHDRVEVIRHGFARRADQSGLKRLMAQAAQSATGCPLRPHSIEGDTGVHRAHLVCD